jgi:uncharacterized protein
MTSPNLTGFHIMSKPVGPICNLDCKYCFYLEKERLYPEKAGNATVSRWSMGDELLESYIRQYIEAQPIPVITFAWQGGEPTLLGVDYFRKVAALQQKYAGGRTIDNQFQTNGVLLDDQWCEFLATSKFLVGLSIDGPRHLHDRYRVDKGGAPTFDKVMHGLRLLKQYRIEFNTLTVVQRDNSQHPLEVYRFLKEVGSGFMQFIPVVERAGEEVTDWSVESLQYGTFLNAIFDEWVRNDVGRFYIQIFDVALESWVGMQPSLCVFRETCGSAMAIEHNGDLYSCDHFVYPQYRLGNLNARSLGDMVRSGAQTAFGEAKRDTLPRYCRECDVRFACNGECPKHRFTLTPDGEAGLNYLCSGYKLFFHHIDPYMKFMAAELRAERAPANVMKWANRPPARNAPCVCGSGRKYKNCCG